MKRIALGILLSAAVAGCSTGRYDVTAPSSSIPTEPLVERDDAPPGDTQPTDTQSTNTTSGTSTIATSPAGVPATVNNGAWLGAATTSRFVRAGGSQQFIGVWVDVPEMQPQAHVPMSLTLTIDTSGSMAGDKIRHAREAARTVIQNLEEGDLIAVHAFSDRARELLRPTLITPQTRAAALSTISELSADGATNMFDALNLASNRAMATPATHPVRRVVVISDGRATAGPTDANTLAQIAARGTQFGVQVTSLGVGLDYDETTLNALAVRSSGRLYHLNDSREMASIIRNELKLLQSTMATAAFVELVAAPGVQLLGAVGDGARWGSNRSLRIPLGTMFSGQRREALIRYRINGGATEGKRVLASARFLFNDPNDDGIQRVQESIVRAELTSDPALVAEHTRPEVQSIVALSNFGNVAQSARGQVAAGDFDGAEKELAKAELALRHNAKHAKNKRDRQRVLAAANKVSHSRKRLKKAASAPPAARPAAARASSLELNDIGMDAMGF